MIKAGRAIYDFSCWPAWCPAPLTQAQVKRLDGIRKRAREPNKSARKELRIARNEFDAGMNRP